MILSLFLHSSLLFYNSLEKLRFSKINDSLFVEIRSIKIILFVIDFRYTCAADNVGLSPYSLTELSYFRLASTLGRCAAATKTYLKRDLI